MSAGRTGPFRLAARSAADDVRLVWNAATATVVLLVLLLLAVAGLAWVAPAPTGSLGASTGLSEAGPVCCVIAP